ncbi:DUF2637 domain-containing protein [Kitasatospora sp. NBC_00070]|uniref:DUF2637 domain-containing protein n=1 Tax=Kitasatospora sp. NBC_00070 TaxID=2975962 RepID=UPI0032545276
MTAEQIRSAERALTAGTWTITCGAVLYSVLTVTPLMRSHSPEGWEWTAPILPLVVDAAVVIVVRMDSILARLGGQGGRWPVVLRWLTGAMTLLLNIGLSALDRDPVGVVVHAVAPLLLIVTAEASLSYRRAIGSALAAREAGERAERAERERVAEEKRLRERTERLAEFDAADRRERERREHEAALLREQREHEQQLLLSERAERERLEAAERAERERREREVSEREQDEREHLARLRHELMTAEPAAVRLLETDARMIVRVAIATEVPQRRVVEVTGWSAGWVANRFQELRELIDTEGPLAVGMALR